MVPRIFIKYCIATCSDFNQSIITDLYDAIFRCLDVVGALVRILSGLQNRCNKRFFTFFNVFFIFSTFFIFKKRCQMQSVNM